MAKYDKSQYRFVNPYNFVPANLKETKRINVLEESEKITGYFQCRIRCKTPLAIPDVEHKEGAEGEHCKYPFLTVDGKYVIPGSTIRGVIRNVYETLTDSCFCSVQGNPAITARSSKSFNPGLLIKNKQGDWELYNAEKHLVVVDQSFHNQQRLGENGIAFYSNPPVLSGASMACKTGDKINFELACNGRTKLQYEKHKRNGRIIKIGIYVKRLQQYQSGSKLKEGYVCIGEKSPRRHFQSIFEKDGKVPNVVITKEDIQRLEDVLEEYRNKKKNKLYPNPHKGYPDYEHAKRNGVIPVYYFNDNGRLDMTFAALGRKAYHKRWNDIVSEKAHDKCDKRSQLCPACALFGTAHGDKYGSRVRFTDAEYTGNMGCLRNEQKTFAELGSPRISYTPFYMRETGEKANYSVGYDSAEMEIRGRKYYWHHVPDTRFVHKNKRNATFEIIKKSAEFGFKIYFDGITEPQLALLAMAIHLNENRPDGHMCHKMGHGKPLGYGSVKIYIEECKVRVFDLNDGWKEESREIPCNVTCHTCSDETLNALNTICNFNTLKLSERINVEYPGIMLDERYENIRDRLKDNVLASHVWFSRNYKLGSQRPENSLPEILDKDLTLPKYKAIEIMDNDIRRK